ncbi:hypothetical protein ACQKM9_01460 [Viridibacillus sp. NPDC093762]|uniref:hypothetical protein n=1 Tax=Viridibacillus sp. NPDC093762 TaxID=3390720 RepID=UPI003D06EA43
MYGIKIVFGINCYIINEKLKKVLSIYLEIIVFSILKLELDPTYEEIIELAALKVRDNKIVDRYESIENRITKSIDL